MCPYARFQSAMFDKDTLIVTYDEARGEPRGPRSKKTDPKSKGLGACVDCTLCVQVCPTGIDIRKGLQYECIGCAACIDVCDGVMDKMGYAKGLIRYSTENGVVNGWTRLQMFKRALRPRVLVYGAVLSAASIAFAASVAMAGSAPFSNRTTSGVSSGCSTVRYERRMGSCQQTSGLTSSGCLPMRSASCSCAKRSSQPRNGSWVCQAKQSEATSEMSQMRIAFISSKRKDRPCESL